MEQEDKKLIIEIPGESVTLTNVISDELWNDKNIEEAAHLKDHPYLSQPKIFVKVNSGSPITALDKAATRVVDRILEFREEFKRALKK